MKTFAVLFCLSLSAQVADKANERYHTPEDRKGVMDGLIQSSRDKTQRPKELVAALRIKPGMTVADMGTGGGYMLRYLSEAVGPSGKVVAEDIYPDFLDLAKKTAASLRNVEFVLGNEKESHLPEKALDLVLLLDVYHHFNYPKETLADLRKKLKPGGRLAIVEYHKNEVAMPNGRAMEHIRLGEKDAIREIESNGFRLISHEDFNPQSQWLALFDVKL